MKNKHLLILFLISSIVIIIGALFKIMHWSGASILLTIGLLSEVLVVVMLILKLFNDDKNNFLNK